MQMGLGLYRLPAYFPSSINEISGTPSSILRERFSDYGLCGASYNACMVQYPGDIYLIEDRKVYMEYPTTDPQRGKLCNIAEYFGGVEIFSSYYDHLTEVDEFKFQYNR